jgi:Domain of unknown function (DUF4956)
MNELFGAALVPSVETLTSLAARLILNLLFTVVTVRVVYSRLYHQRDYIFTYLILNVVTFSLAFLLSKAPIGLGSAFGLFAVFGILRYRTEAIQVRNLTYLFVVIGIALLNALANKDISLVELVIVNMVIVGAVGLLEAASFSGREESRQVVYDRLELLSPDTSSELLKDLRRRTRLPVERFEIGDVDLLRDAANITVYYPVSSRRANGVANAP